jgi:hypothetical protein
MSPDVKLVAAFQRSAAAARLQGHSKSNAAFLLLFAALILMATIKLPAALINYLTAF